MKSNIWLFTSTLLLLILVGSATSAQMLYGEILEVFPEQNKLRLLVDGEMRILRLDTEAEIYRSGQTVSIESTRPVYPGRYQEGLVYLNSLGHIQVLVVEYRVEEVKGYNGSVLYYIDIFGNVKDVERLSSIQKEFEQQ